MPYKDPIARAAYAKEYGKKWAAANKDKRRASGAKWAKANPDKNRAKARRDHAKRRDEINATRRHRYHSGPEIKAAVYAWRNANPDKAKEIDKKYRSKNRDKRNSAMQRWYRGNKERVIDNNRQWRLRNPEKHKASKYRAKMIRRALEVGAPGECSWHKFLSRVEYFGWSCIYCRASLTLNTLTVEHIIPLSRGGSQWPSNLGPACKPCNLRKNNKMPHEFLGQHHRFLVPLNVYAIAPGSAGINSSPVAMANL